MMLFQQQIIQSMKSKEYSRFIEDGLEMKLGKAWIHQYNLWYRGLTNNDCASLVRQVQAFENSRKEGHPEIVLKLGSNRINHTGCFALTFLIDINLQEIWLDNNRIGELGCKYLVKSSWPQLRVLNLNENKISDKGCGRLRKASWDYLQKLFLIDNHIQVKGCAYLLQIYLPKLDELELRGNPIREGECRECRKIIWKQLQRLGLMRCPIERQGYLFLKKMPVKFQCETKFTMQE